MNNNIDDNKANPNAPTLPRQNSSAPVQSAYHHSNVNRNTTATYPQPVSRDPALDTQLREQQRQATANKNAALGLFIGIGAATLIALGIAALVWPNAFKPNEGERPAVGPEQTENLNSPQVDSPQRDTVIIERTREVTRDVVPVPTTPEPTNQTTTPEINVNPAQPQPQAPVPNNEINITQPQPSTANPTINDATPTNPGAITTPELPASAPSEPASSENGLGDAQGTASEVSPSNPSPSAETVDPSTSDVPAERRE